MATLSRFVAVLAVLALVGAACGGDDASSAETTTSVVAVTTTIQDATTTVAPTTTVQAATTTVAPTTTTSAPPAASRVEVNGAQLVYECFGEGSPTVVFESGAGASSKEDPEWWGLKEAYGQLAQTYTVCFYGRRGIGGSDRAPTDSARTTQDQVDDLDALITALDLETPVILMGHSIGGWNLTVYADAHPDRVAGLIFLDATPYEYVESASAEQVRSASDLGDIPLYVLTASVGHDSQWMRWQEDMTGWSTNSKQRTVSRNHAEVVFAVSTIRNALKWIVKQSS